MQEILTNYADTLDEFQATDEGQYVLLARFDEQGQALWVRELSPEQAIALAEQLLEGAHSVLVDTQPLSESAIQEVKDYLTAATTRRKR